MRSARPVCGLRQPERQKDRGEAEEGGNKKRRKDVAVWDKTPRNMSAPDSEMNIFLKKRLLGGKTSKDMNKMFCCFYEVNVLRMNHCT